MAPLPQATGAAFAERAQQLLKDAAELTSGDNPNLIRDAEPVSLFDAIPLAAARQGCRRYADNPEQYSGRRQARVERACRPYLDNINYGEPPTVSLPFRGGQCYTNYSYIYSFRNPNTGEIQDSPQTISGRIIGLFERNNSNGVTKTGGVERQLAPGAPIDQISLGTTNIGAPLDQSIRNIQRTDGLPDDCGNPPTDITDPVPPPAPGPVREPFVRVPDVNIDIGVEVNPDLTINVDFGTGPITIDPFGDGPSGGGDGSGGAPPGDVGNPGNPEDTGQGGEADGEAPEGTILTGLRVDFVEPPIGGKEYAPGVYRGVCYIYMGTAEGLDHDPAGAMLKDGQFVFAEKDNLTQWSVSANAGYNLRVTPYYRPAEAEE